MKDWLTAKSAIEARIIEDALEAGKQSEMVCKLHNHCANLNTQCRKATQAGKALDKIGKQLQEGGGKLEGWASSCS